MSLKKSNLTLHDPTLQITLTCHACQKTEQNIFWEKNNDEDKKVSDSKADATG